MKLHSSIFTLSLFGAFNQVYSNPLNHIYQNFNEEPGAFLFNSAIIITLLTVGGILAGKTHFIRQGFQFIKVSLSV